MIGIDQQHTAEITPFFFLENSTVVYLVLIAGYAFCLCCVFPYGWLTGWRFVSRPHYDGSKRHMMYERIVQSVGRGRTGKVYDAAEVTQVTGQDPAMMPS